MRASDYLKRLKTYFNRRLIASMAACLCLSRLGLWGCLRFPRAVTNGPGAGVTGRFWLGGGPSTSSGPGRGKMGVTMSGAAATSASADASTISVPSSDVHGSARPESPGFGSALGAHGLTKSKPGPWAVAGPSRRLWGRKPRLGARDAARDSEPVCPMSVRPPCGANRLTQYFIHHSILFTRSAERQPVGTK